MYIRLVYTNPMAMTKVFRSGNSQAVRIPRQFHLHSKKVLIERRGAELILKENPSDLAHAFELLTHLSGDFFRAGRRQPKPQRRLAL
jgi:antitoxin VapB